MLKWLAAGLLVSTALPACAQTFPAKPVRIVLGYSTGGTADNLGRVIAERLTVRLGQSVLIENRPGASGNIAAQAVSRAAPDGYTLLFGNTAEMAINKHLTKDMAFNPDADFAAVALIHNVPLGLIVSAKSPHGSFSELLDNARRATAGISFANSGTGSPAHLASETLMARAKVRIVQVPYKGAAPAVVDLLGGRVEAYFLGLPGAMPHVKAGTVRLVAVSTAKRAATAPEVPSVAEHGMPGFDFSLWGGIFAPAATPRDIVIQLNREILQVLTNPEMRAQLAREGSAVVETTPESFAHFVRTESRKYAELLREISYKPE
ncbi:MAG: Bug family tripartite tricarboxylate transporter substrate binding protein [Burkholderiales bacterium]